MLGSSDWKLAALTDVAAKLGTVQTGPIVAAAGGSTAATALSEMSDSHASFRERKVQVLSPCPDEENRVALTAHGNSALEEADA